MKKIWLLLILSLYFISPVLAENKIVFEDYDKVYIALYGFKQCQDENVIMQDMIDNLSKQLETNNNQIESLKKIDSICSEHNKDLDLTIKELKDIIIDNKETVSRLETISSIPFSQKLRDSLGSIGIGFTLGVITILIF